MLKIEMYLLQVTDTPTDIMAVPKPILISIEGDIGAGKSTLIWQLKSLFPTWHFIDEPVNTWLDLKNTDGTNLLELFYKDKDRYAYTFQNCAVLTRAMKIQAAIQAWQKDCILNPELASHNIFITERCLDTDVNVFAKMMYDDGKLNDIEWQLYTMWYNYVKEQTPSLTGIIYLTTPPEICSQRIKLRGRKGEEDISLDYLKELDSYQKVWMYGSMIASVKKLDYNNYSETLTSLEDVESFVASCKTNPSC